MFYPTCYVYKIASNNESISNHRTTSSNKKCDVSSIKKSKNPTTSTIQSTTTPSINSPLDLGLSTNKNETMLIKNLSNQLLICAQRNNCIDLEIKYV